MTKEPLWHEHTRSLTPVCPYCGYKRRDAWEINFGPGMDGETEITCGGCEQDYIVAREVNIDYSSRKLPKKDSI